ncbi:MAG TPA: hypothetical protein VGH80_06355, partial [Xanthomonadaceae bacterium]
MRGHCRPPPCTPCAPSGFIHGPEALLLAQPTRGCGPRNTCLWYVIADANNLEDPNAGLTEGIELKTPAVQVTSNNASTLKPYDPNS